MRPAVARAKDPALTLAQRIKNRVQHDYFVRMHMSLILTAVVASGVLTSKGLLELGVRSLPFRYPLAVLSSYLVFLGLVRVWIWYVSRRQSMVSSLDPGNIDLGGFGGGSGSGGGSGGGSFGFGGGDSGGGGASSSWEAGAVNAQVAPPVPASSSSGSSWFSVPDIDLDLGDDGWWILLVLALLVLAIFCAGGYLIYAAPQILPEAACQAVLASTLTRVSKEQHHGWMRGVLKSTVLPFTMVLLLAGGLGYVTHRHCPQAARLMDALYCPVNQNR